MHTRHIVCFDLETGGRDPDTCQPTQIAAIGLHGRTLKPMGEFQSMIWAETDDEKAVAANLAPLEADALKVTGQTREEIAAAPKLKNVWPKFQQFVNKMNPSGKPFFNPVPAGYNIINYDIPIIRRICKEYGPWDSKRNDQALFSQVFKIDMMDNLYMWMENDHDVTSISMDAIRKMMGIDGEGAHDALVDVKHTCQVMTRFLQTHRAVYKNLRF